MKKTTYNKANRKHTNITVLGITVLMLLTLMAIEGAAQCPVCSNDELIKLGSGLMHSRNYPGAFQVFDNATRNNDAHDTCAWWLKGNALRRLMRPIEAIVAYNASIDHDPHNSKAWNNKGIALDYLHKYNESIDAYNKAIDIDPHDSKAWNNKGVALRSLGQYDEAITAYDKAIEINPQDSRAWYNKGFALEHLSKYDEAVTAFEKATDIDPLYPNAWHEEGIVLGNLNRSDEARAANQSEAQNPGEWSDLEEDETPTISDCPIPWYMKIWNSVSNDFVQACNAYLVTSLGAIISAFVALLLAHYTGFLKKLWGLWEKLRGKGT
jgi:superkiller protein 3